MTEERKWPGNAGNLYCRCHGIGSEYLELTGQVIKLLYDCFFPHGSDVLLGGPRLHFHHVNDGISQFTVCKRVCLLEDTSGNVLEVCGLLLLLILIGFHAHIARYVLLLAPSEMRHWNVKRTAVPHLDALDYRECRINVFLDEQNASRLVGCTLPSTTPSLGDNCYLTDMTRHDNLTLSKWKNA